MMHRRDALQRLRKSNEFDLCVIGGGATGAGCALDAALRGLKVVLIEQGDFAAETSSRSTKLIHGGVRYLEQAFLKGDLGQLRQVWHGLQERQTLLDLAPHLTRPLALITPVYSRFEAWYYRIGLWLYDRFAARNDVLPSSRLLSRKETIRRLPGIDPNIAAAVMYYDGQLDDARFALAVIQSAERAGAIVLNYAQIQGFQHDETGAIQSASIQNVCRSDDRYLVKARIFLNCTGPFSDNIRLMANPSLPMRIQPSKGAHAVLPLDVLGAPAGEATGLLIPKTPDGRVVFCIPFGQSLLLGTTDTPVNQINVEPFIDAREIHFLLQTLQPFVGATLTPDMVTAGFAGIRPLIAAPGKDGGKSLLRDHEIEYDDLSGLFSVLGGKWTTYRLMAQDAIDRVAEKLGRTETCTTARHLLVGGEPVPEIEWRKQTKHFPISPETLRHLLDTYGAETQKVLDLARQNPDLFQQLHPDLPYIRAEVIYAARHEMACTVRDFLARRIRLEIANWELAAQITPLVAELMGAELGWEDKDRREQIKRYQDFIRQSIGQIRSSAG